MNQLTNALAQAGVKLPSTTERIWRAVKDEPGLTQAQLCKRLASIPKGTVSGRLHDMEVRGMVYTSGVKNQGGGWRDAVKAYHTDLDAFQLLPRPRKSPRTNRPTKVSRRTTHQVAPAVTPPAEREVFDLDAMTIREARALYAQLKEMFA